VNPLDDFRGLPELRKGAAHRTLRAVQRMKMLFFSSDNAEVQEVSREFTQAGIPCEVRKGLARNGHAVEAELWIQNDRDCHRAFLLCVEQGIGFARRPSELMEAELDWWAG
jgi:hypothetical protein